MSVIDNIGDSIPDVIVDHVILHDDKIEVRMHINEFMYTPTKGTWSTNTDYVKDLNIVVGIIGTHLQARSKLTRTENLILPTTAGFHKIYFTNTFDLVGDIQEGDVTLTAQTSIPASHLRDTIDIGALPFDGLFGRKTSINVIKNGEAQTRTLGYFLGASFYTGPRTQLANGRWVTGNVQNESSQFLLERNVPNMQVLDNRDLFNLSSYETGGYDAPTQIAVFQDNPGATIFSTPRQPSIFSKFSTTRDPSGL